VGLDTLGLDAGRKALVLTNHGGEMLAQALSGNLEIDTLLFLAPGSAALLSTRN